MPAFNLGDLMSQATARAGRRADIPQSVASFWVNVAYQEVAAVAPYAAQEQSYRSSFGSGVSFVLLPTDYDSPLALSLETGPNLGTSGRTLNPRKIGDLDADAFYPVGTPAEYAIYNDRIVFQPSSDSTYTALLRYLSQTSDLVNLTDVPSVATEWRPAILYLAEAEMWAYVNHPTEENIARQRYFNKLSTLRSDQAKRQRDQGIAGAVPLYPEVRAVSKRSFDIV